MPKFEVTLSKHIAMVIDDVETMDAAGVQAVAEMEDYPEPMPWEVSNVIPYVEQGDAPQREPATTVFDYFARQLGVAHSDDNLRELPVDSLCGRDCCAAINAAKVFAEHARRANDCADEVIYICDRIVSIYWRG
jgi:hypothetical protein